MAEGSSQHRFTTEQNLVPEIVPSVVLQSKLQFLLLSFLRYTQLRSYYHAYIREGEKRIYIFLTYSSKTIDVSLLYRRRFFYVIISL